MPPAPSVTEPRQPAPALRPTQRVEPAVRQLRERLAELAQDHPSQAGATDPRYEIKFAVPAEWLVDVRAWLRLHPACLRQVHPARQVNSLYFDTQTLACLQDNLAGIASRSKLRWRWYGRKHASVRGVLELKIKQGMVGWKRHYARGTVLPLSSEPWPALLRGMRAEAPPEWRLHLAQVDRPTTLVSYERDYLESADGTVRATIDRDVCAYDQLRGLRPNLRWKSPIPRRVILELKCAAGHRDKLSEVAGGLPTRIQRCSKYATAMLATLG